MMSLHFMFIRLFILRHKKESGETTMKKQNSNNTKGWTAVSTVFFVLLLLSEGLALMRLWKLDVLPTKFFIPLIVVIVLVTLVLMAMMFPKIGRHLKTKCIGRRVTAYVLSALIAAAALLGGHMVGRLNQAVDIITTPETASTYVGVFVRADDPAETIEDVSKYTFAITNSFDPESTEKTIADLSELWGTPALTRTYESAFEMVDALLAKEVDGIIMNESFLEVFAVNEDYLDFEIRTKMIHRHSVVATVKPTEPAETVSTEPTEATTAKDALYAPFICYLSGSDTREQMLRPARSDVNILAVVNPETHQILLISTPRDYFISNPALGNRRDKLTHCGIYGVDCSVQALSQLYEQEIDYTAKINFVGFETLIDSIGGIDIYSENGDGVLLDAGNNHMDGAEALYFARDRYDYAAGDNARGQHQMMVIKAVVEKMATGAIITSYNEILESLEGMFITSVPSEKISGLIKMQQEDMRPWDVHSFTATGTGGNDRPASMSQNAYVMYPNQASVKKASELIDRVFNDEILTAQDLEY